MRASILLIIVILSFKYSNSQTFTQGCYGQMYWDWRPDIASNCYEFTFVTSRDAMYNPISFSPTINLFYWDDCNYGKNYINVNDTTGMADNPPLHDTLHLITSQFGVRDTFCGFNAPYQKGNAVGMAETTSPHRVMLQYRGLVHLPEKCNQWHFVIGKYYHICLDASSDRHYFFANGSGGTSYPDYVISNLDSVFYKTISSTFVAATSWHAILGCSFNNIDFPDNSSVRFTSPPLYYYQIQKSVEYNPGPFDPNHDSIVVTIPDTIKTPAYLVDGEVTVLPGFNTQFFRKTDLSGNPSPNVWTHDIFFAPLPGQTGPNPIRFNGQNNPFDTDSTFHLVDSTGRTTFTAKSAMEPVLYFSAKEYRQQKFVSETYCFSQFTLMNDLRPVSFMKIDTAHMHGAMFNNQGTMRSCAGFPINFDAYVKLPFVSVGNLIVRTTSDSTLPGNAICTIAGVHTDSVHLNFSWTPPPGTRGLYNVFITAKDSSCNIPYNHYLQVYTWSFYVDSCLYPLDVTQATNEEGNLLLYPNPTNDKLTISGTESFSSIKIYTLLSELVYEKKVKPTKQLEISTADLPASIYLVNIDGKYIRKLVIEK